MAKKNHDIQIDTREIKADYQGMQVEGIALSSGKKEIGKVLEISEKKFIVQIPEEFEQTVHSQNEGIEMIIRFVNLHN